MTSPAKNAPSDRESPTLDVSHAMDRQKASVVSRNSSRLRVRTIRCSALGTILRATTNTSTITPAPFNVSRTSDSLIDAPLPVRKGMSSIMGTMTMSCRMSMDREMPPWGLFISARCWMMRSTMAVDDSVARKPKNTAWPGAYPSDIDRASKAMIVSSTCAPPPRKTCFFSRESSARDSSMPMVNSSSTTPTSAMISTSCTALTSPKPCGPASTPVSRNPTMAGTLIRWHK